MTFILGKAADPLLPADVEHEHVWKTASAHDTSQGRVFYVHCEICHAHRVLMQEIDRVLPVTASRVIRAG